MFDTKHDYAALSLQPECLKEYFAKIGREDPYNLNVDGFFSRVCNSLANNGLKSTCEFYGLDQDVIGKIQKQRWI